jgi:hypothetical protein
VWLLSLYPRAWRERYGAEMLALLEQHDVTLATRLDLLRGAWDAWIEQRRNVMAPVLAASWRGARLGLIPCVLRVAWFLLSLDLNADTTLLNLLFFMSPPSIAAMLLVCLWAGKREAEGNSAWGGRLAAGAAAGIVGLLASIAVQDGLMLTDLGLGVSSQVIALQGGSVSHSQTFVFAPGTLVSPRSLLSDAVAIAVACALGASAGALGTALAGLRLTRGVRSA